MQSRNGRPSPPGDTAGGGTVRAQPPDNELTSQNPPQPPGTGDDSAPAENLQVALPAGPGQLPPDRPRPPEPRPLPPVPAELPKRRADPSRPSVPSRYSRRPPRAPGAGPPGPRDSSGQPGVPAPPVGPLPTELFRPLWWQERPDKGGPPQPSPEPGRPEAGETEAGRPEAGDPEAGDPEAGDPEASEPDPGKPEPPPRQRLPTEPSWGTVLATTVRLWLQRRLSSTRRSRAGRPRRLVIIVAGLVAAALLAGAGAVALSGRGRQGAGQPGTADKALAAAAVARQSAAAWVAGQASPDAIVACDPAMCAALEAHGVPAGRLLTLTPARSDPLGSDLVVATAAVRGQFRARLVGVYAPVTLASFGSGTARIDVRVVAPDGSAAYWTALAADVRARGSAGAQLLRNRSIHVSGSARTALADGKVDPRLLVTLAALSHLHPLDVTGFGGRGSGASAGVPLRSAEIAGAAPPGPGHPASLHSLMVVLQAQRPPFVPSSLEIVRIPGGAVLRIGFPVPSPLGLLRSAG
jgi:hypothetical protein